MSVFYRPRFAIDEPLTPRPSDLSTIQPEGLAEANGLWHDGHMKRTKAKPKKQVRKNPTDVNLLARSVVEAAIGESLIAPIKRNKKP